MTDLRRLNEEQIRELKNREAQEGREAAIEQEEILNQIPSPQQTDMEEGNFLQDPDEDFQFQTEYTDRTDITAGRAGESLDAWSGMNNSNGINQTMIRMATMNTPAILAQTAGFSDAAAAFDFTDHIDWSDPFGWSNLSKRWSEQTIGKEWREGQMEDIWRLVPDEWKPHILNSASGFGNWFAEQDEATWQVAGYTMPTIGNLTVDTVKVIGTPFEWLAQGISKATGLDYELASIVSDFIPIGGIAGAVAKRGRVGERLGKVLNTLQTANPETLKNITRYSNDVVSKLPRAERLKWWINETTFFPELKDRIFNRLSKNAPLAYASDLDSYPYESLLPTRRFLVPSADPFPRVANARAANTRAADARELLKETTITTPALPRDKFGNRVYFNQDGSPVLGPYASQPGTGARAAQIQVGLEQIGNGKRRVYTYPGPDGTSTRWVYESGGRKPDGTIRIKSINLDNKLINNQSSVGRRREGFIPLEDFIAELGGEIGPRGFNVNEEKIKILYKYVRELNMNAKPGDIFHLDHILPVANQKGEKVWRTYRNLLPLFAQENIVKSNRMFGPDSKLYSILGISGDKATTIRNVVDETFDTLSDAEKRVLVLEELGILKVSDTIPPSRIPAPVPEF